MVARNLLNDVLALPVEDRLEFFEELRQNLINDPAVDALTDEQKRVLDEGLAELDADPDGGEPWEEFEARMLGILKARS